MRAWGGCGGIDLKGELMFRRHRTPPVRFDIQPTAAGSFQVLKNGTLIREYTTRGEAQTYIDTYRQAAARLNLQETPEDLPLDALTDEEREILGED